MSNSYYSVSIDTAELADPRPESRSVNTNAWAVEPQLTEGGTLRDVLRHDFASVLAAYVLAYVPGADLADLVRWRPSYAGPGVGKSSLKDLEHNGVIYREFHGRIYVKRRLS